MLVELSQPTVKVLLDPCVWADHYQVANLMDVEWLSAVLVENAVDLARDGVPDELLEFASSRDWKLHTRELTPPSAVLRIKTAAWARRRALSGGS